MSEKPHIPGCPRRVGESTCDCPPEGAETPPLANDPVVHLCDWAQQPEVHLFCDPGPGGDTPAFSQPELPEGVYLRADGKRYAFDQNLATCPLCLRAALGAVQREAERAQQKPEPGKEPRWLMEERAEQTRRWLDAGNRQAAKAVEERDAEWTVREQTIIARAEKAEREIGRIRSLVDARSDETTYAATLRAIEACAKLPDEERLRLEGNAREEMVRAERLERDRELALNNAEQHARDRAVWYEQAKRLEKLVLELSGWIYRHGKERDAALARAGTAERERDALKGRIRAGKEPALRPGHYALVAFVEKLAKRLGCKLDWSESHDHTGCFPLAGGAPSWTSASCIMDRIDEMAADVLDQRARAADGEARPVSGSAAPNRTGGDDR